MKTNTSQLDDYNYNFYCIVTKSSQWLLIIEVLRNLKPKYILSCLSVYLTFKNCNIEVFLRR